MNKCSATWCDNERKEGSDMCEPHYNFYCGDCLMPASDCGCKI